MALARNARRFLPRGIPPPCFGIRPGRAELRSSLIIGMLSRQYATVQRCKGLSFAVAHAHARRSNDDMSHGCRRAGTYIQENRNRMTGGKVPTSGAEARHDLIAAVSFLLRCLDMDAQIRHLGDGGGVVSAPSQSPPPTRLNP